MKEIAAELEQWLRTGEPVAIATVVRITGSAPRPLGATLIARSGEKIAGSVSNGCVESAVYEEAMAVLRDGRPRVVTYGISDEFAFTVGLSCGGAIGVLIEPIGALHRAAHLEDLGQDRERDLFVVPGADVQSGGIFETRQPIGTHASALEHIADDVASRPARDEPHITRRRR